MTPLHNCTLVSSYTRDKCHLVSTLGNCSFTLFVLIISILAHCWSYQLHALVGSQFSITTKTTEQNTKLFQQCQQSCTHQQWLMLLENPFSHFLQPPRKSQRTNVAEFLDTINAPYSIFRYLLGLPKMQQCIKKHWLYQIS